MPDSRPSSPSAGWRVHVALAAVSLLFGLNYGVAKVVLREVSAFDLVALRAAGAAVLLSAGAWIRPASSSRAPLRLAHAGWLFLFSLLAVSVNQFCFLEGLARSTATNAALVQVTIPVLTLAIAVLLRRERATLAAGCGVALGLAGALILILPRGGLDFSSDAAIGNLFLISGSVTYALYLVLARPLLATHDPVATIAWIFIFAAGTVLPMRAASLAHLPSAGLSPTTWWGLVFVVAGATAVPYLLNAWALGRVRSSIVAIYVLLQPLVGATVARIFLHEAIQPHTGLAAALIMTGVLLGSRHAPATARTVR